MKKDKLIIKYFKFLMDDFGFKVTGKNFNKEMMGNAYVNFTSKTTGIQIVVDRNQVFITIGKITEPIKNWLQFSDALKFYNPDEKAYIFYEKTDSISWDEAERLQLDRLSKIILNCTPLLLGDFSEENNIRKKEEQRVKDIMQHLNAINEEYINRKNRN